MTVRSYSTAAFQSMWSFGTVNIVFLVENYEVDFRKARDIAIIWIENPPSRRSAVGVSYSE